VSSWCGSPPEKCDLCGKGFEREFIDGRTIYGAWAFMCKGCHASRGCGLGTGHGQRYEKKGDGFWVKVEG